MKQIIVPIDIHDDNPRFYTYVFNFASEIGAGVIFVLFLLSTTSRHRWRGASGRRS